MIALQSISFRYPGAETCILSDLSFQLEQGRLCCCVGLNGSGKSTLLALLAGILAPTSGALVAAGCELPKEAKRFTGKAAFVPQNPDIYILGSLVEEDLLLALPPGDVDSRKKAMEIAGQFGLSDLMNNAVHTLSHGQKRKLSLASALAADPQLLLLDEPFAGLDQPSVIFMRKVLKRNKKSGITQIITGHDLDLAADLADWFILLQQGQLVCQGTAGEVFPKLKEHGVRPPCWWCSGGNRPLWE